LRSRSLGPLLVKEARELLASRAYWLLLLATGLLAGHAFLTAVDTYAEMSGVGGGPAALVQGLTPLDGIVVPTFGVLALAATLLLPFVAIRVIVHERESGAWKLLVQGPASIPLQLMVKLLVLIAGWCLAWLPAIVALVLWVTHGNHLDWRETLSVLLGHALFAWLTIGVAAAAAALTDSDSAAAIVALGFTIGTWALDFVGAARGGWVADLARYTPTAALGSFEQALVRAGTVAVMLIAGLTGVTIAAIWLDPGRRRARVLLQTGITVAVSVGLMAAAAQLHATWDLSENRRNSFPLADEVALRTIQEPLRVEVHLAPGDPRLVDLRERIFEKLERVFPRVDVVEIARTQTGLFEQSDSAYGEVWYQLGARRAMTRSETEPIVLEQIYTLAGITPPAVTETTYPGYPLMRRPSGIGLIFFAGWPLLLLFIFAMWRALGARIVSR
jgi:ABC-2 type transport system permease protein